MGEAVTQGRQCRNFIAAANLQEAESLLRQISHLEPSFESLSVQLDDIAHRMLCKRWHQGQARDVVAEWKAKIRKYVAARPDRTTTVRLQRTAATSTSTEVSDDFENEVEAEIARLRTLQARRRRAARPMEIDVSSSVPRHRTSIRDSAEATDDLSPPLMLHGGRHVLQPSRPRAERNATTSCGSPEASQQPSPPLTPVRRPPIPASDSPPISDHDATSFGSSLEFNFTFSAPNALSPSTGHRILVQSLTPSGEEDSATANISSSLDSSSGAEVPSEQVVPSEIPTESEPLAPPIPTPPQSPKIAQIIPDPQDTPVAAGIDRISGDCSICYERLLDGSSLVCCRTQCKQYFHRVCMNIWLRDNLARKRCPYW